MRRILTPAGMVSGPPKRGSRQMAGPRRSKFRSRHSTPHIPSMRWGINFKRFIRGKNEEDLWRAYRRTFGLTKVSEAGELRGIHDIGSGRPFIAKPYGLARYDKQTGQAPLSPLTAGVDIKYGLSSSLLLNLTGNTDFADAEVDLQPFNITPFKVYLPEKRDFFLENAGVFNFPLDRKS